MKNKLTKYSSEKYTVVSRGLEGTHKKSYNKDLYNPIYEDENGHTSEVSEACKKLNNSIHANFKHGR